MVGLGLTIASADEGVCLTACGPFALSASTTCAGTGNCHTQCTCVPGTGPVNGAGCDGVDEWSSNGHLHRCTLDGSQCVPIALPVDWSELSCPGGEDFRNPTSHRCICADDRRGWRCTVETCTGGCSGDPCHTETATCECRDGRTGCSCEVDPPSLEPKKKKKDTVVVVIDGNTTYAVIREETRSESAIVTAIVVCCSVAVFAVLIWFIVAK